MRRLAATLACALALSVPPALAQQSGPIRLTPLPPPTADAPETRTEGQLYSGPQADPSTSAPIETPGGVLIRGLDAVAEDAVGVLSAANGSLGDDMWAGTDRATAIRLLEALPPALPFSDTRDLARRLLLSIATPPAGDSETSGLLAARLAGLVAIGAPADAIELARAASSRSVPDHIAQAVTSAHFLRGDVAAGCDVLARFEGGYVEPFWQKALIVCQIADGKGAEAALGLDLLREEGTEADRFFETIAYTATAGSAIAPEQLAGPGTPDILTFALLTITDAELPDWMLTSDDPAILRAVLALHLVDPLRKLARAHDALRTGQISAAEVVAIYEGLEADDEAIAAALLDPDSVERDLWLAYLYLAARGQTVAIARSEALWEAWSLAEAAELDDIVMATTARLLADIPATSDFGWLAAGATRAALLAGEDDLAITWYQLVVRQASAVADMARATAMLWPEMRVIGRDPVQTEAAMSPEPEATPDPRATIAANAVPPVGAAVSAPRAQPVFPIEARAPVPWSPTRLSRWIDLAENNPGTAEVGAALYLLQVLGDPVTGEHWAAAPIGNEATLGAMPGVAALAGLARASAAERRAETILYALIVLGQAGAPPHAGIVGSVVRGLQRVGLDADARSIARAALVAPAQ